MSGREDEMDEFELTLEEKMAFQRLPKEAEPSQLLEERVVRSLREEGILGSGVGQGADGGAGAGVEGRDDARPGVGRWFRPWMATAAAAAVGGSLRVGNGSWGSGWDPGPPPMRSSPSANRTRPTSHSESRKRDPCTCRLLPP